MHSCFIGNSGVFFGAVLSPILLIILFNAVVSCMVTVISVRHARNRHKQRKLSSLSLSNVQSKLAIPPGEVCKLVCSLSGVNILLGLTWILSLLTLVGTGDSVEAAFVVRFFFVIFNSFQGFFIFLFFIVFSTDARTPWLKRICPCLKIVDYSTKQSRLYSSRLSANSRKSSTSSLVPTRRNSATSPTRKDSITLQMGIITTTIAEEEEDEPVITPIDEDTLQTMNNDLAYETTSDVNPLITE